MTWRWIFHDQLGALNYLLHLTGITQENIVWLGDAKLAFAAVMFVEVWSSIPFMTITFLAGLQSIPPAHLRRGQDGRRQRPGTSSGT